jgi:hypothetical protein
MQTHAVPAHFVAPPATAPADPGMPQERAARVAARRAFVDLKLTYLGALDSLSGGAGAAAAPSHWLRQQVVYAEDPVDLWLLRAPMFAALSGVQPERRRQRQALRRALETLFPDGDSDAGHSAFATLY